jgi:amidase
MAMRQPSPNQLREVARQCGLSLDEADVGSFRALMVGGVQPTRCPTSCRPCSTRDAGLPARAEENRRNAWYRKTSIKGAVGGKPKGSALKDNIMVAGMPMMKT